jgi:two-component system OmpR family response regulator
VTLSDSTSATTASGEAPPVDLRTDVPHPARLIVIRARPARCAPTGLDVGRSACGCPADNLARFEQDSHVRPLEWAGPYTRVAYTGRPGGELAVDTPRLLVVDDEPNIVDMLRMALRFHGFEVQAARTGREATAAVTADCPDLLVLDVMLPDCDGLDLCRQWRDRGITVPVVFLTARDRHADKVAGLTYGGDDYVTKPFGIDELVARVRAVLRRSRPEPAVQAAQASVLTFADLVLDEDTHLVSRAGHPLELAPTEFRLLRYLLVNPNRVLSREQILAAVWGPDYQGGDTVVDQYISYLRRKLTPHGPSLIHTQRGFGYALRAAGPAGPGTTATAG